MKFTPRQRARLKLLKLKVKALSGGLNLTEVIRAHEELQAIVDKIVAQWKKELFWNLITEFKLTSDLHVCSDMSLYALATLDRVVYQPLCARY